MVVNRVLCNVFRTKIVIQIFIGNKFMHEQHYILLQQQADIGHQQQVLCLYHSAVFGTEDDGWAEEKHVHLRQRLHALIEAEQYMIYSQADTFQNGALRFSAMMRRLRKRGKTVAVIVNSPIKAGPTTVRRRKRSYYRIRECVA